jgi:hypothetical protein
MQVNVTQKAKDSPNPDLHDIVLEMEPEATYPRC